MARVIEKKEWRSPIENCLIVQTKLNKCITTSSDYDSLSKENQKILLDGVSSSLVDSYFGSWKSKGKISDNVLSVHNTESKLWTDNYSSLKNIHEKCNIFGFYECLEDNLNLIKLKGHFSSQYK